MKEESVLTVLMYLFHHHMDRHQSIDLSDSNLLDELKLAGFHAHVIGKAFRWLHGLVSYQEDMQQVSPYAFRVFNEEECSLLDEECRSFILSLEYQGILTPFTREIVIHQALALVNERADVNLIKWVTLMVLFNLPDCDEALAHMEFLVLTDAFDAVH